MGAAWVQRHPHTGSPPGVPLILNTISPVDPCPQHHRYSERPMVFRIRAFPLIPNTISLADPCSQHHRPSQRPMVFRMSPCSCRNLQVITSGAHSAQPGPPQRPRLAPSCAMPAKPPRTCTAVAALPAAFPQGWATAPSSRTSRLSGARGLMGKPRSAACVTRICCRC